MATPTQKKRPYKQSPQGVGRYCWVNRPDTKYNADGVYHLGHVLDGEEAVAHKALIDAEVDRAFLEETKDMTPGELKKWSKYYPYTEETDEENGNSTGRIIFQYKQNAIIRLKDGTTKAFKIGIRDSKNKIVTENVYGGSIIKVMYAPRNVKIVSTHQIGVRLDFSLVQLIKPAERTGAGFDEVEGGYVHEDEPEDNASPKASGGTEGDY